ncbi:hypothetical protein D3C80_1572590 [compost metagenome]
MGRPLQPSRRANPSFTRRLSALGTGMTVTSCLNEPKVSRMVPCAGILSLFMDLSPSITAVSCRMPEWTVWTGILNLDIVDLLPVGSMMPAIMNHKGYISFIIWRHLTLGD